MLDYKKLEELYKKYNKRKFVSPDPLQCLYDYNNSNDREVVAILAASLAYGRVAQILKSIAKILEPMGATPSAFICEHSSCEFRRIFADFKHRFTTGEDIANLFTGIQAALKEYGSLQNCFVSGYSDSDENILPALEAFTKKLCQFFPNNTSYLLPAPSKGSACKRQMLFLRWMIRCDDVDPGGWNNIPNSKLLIPLDTHMHQISTKFKLTTRKNPDLKSTIEITNAFALINPQDPVKYDFTLTRFGIRDEMNISEI